jgi:hypothetical protein
MTPVSDRLLREPTGAASRRDRAQRAYAQVAVRPRASVLSNPHRPGIARPSFARSFSPTAGAVGLRPAPSAPALLAGIAASHEVQSTPADGEKERNR